MKKITRAGVIPFSVYRNEIWLLLSEDLKTGEKGDFGGGKKERESPYQAAMREAREESNGLILFENLETQPHFSIQYKKAVIYFAPFTFDALQRLRESFQNLGGNKEVKNMHIVPLNSIWADRSNSYNMWPFIKRILVENRPYLDRNRFINVFSE